MAARFTKLNNALEKGLDGVSPSAAIEQIEYWEGELKGVDVPGAKGLLHDLESLKKHLHADPIDTAAVGKLTAKLGGETTKIAGHATTPEIGEKLKELGGKLETAG